MREVLNKYEWKQAEKNEEKYVIHQRKQAENIERMQRNPFSKSQFLFLAQMQRWRVKQEILFNGS